MHFFSNIAKGGNYQVALKSCGGTKQTKIRKNKNKILLTITNNCFMIISIKIY